MTSDPEKIKDLNNKIIDAINGSDLEPNEVMMLLMMISAEFCSNYSEPQKAIITYTNLAKRYLNDKTNKKQ